MKKQRYDVDYIINENRRLIAKLREFQAPIPPREKVKMVKKPATSPLTSSNLLNNSFK